MKKEHVIHIITEPKAGGAEFLVRYLNKNLYQYGISSEALFISNEREVKLNENEYCLGLKSPRSILAVKYIRSFIKERLEISDKLIIHSHLTWPLYFVPLASAGVNCKLIFTEHNTINKRRQYPALRVFEKIIYGKYDKIICISKGVYNSLKQWLNYPNASNLEVIYNGAKFYRIKTSKAQATIKGLNIVSVGSLTEQKGFEYSIKAISKVRSIVNKYTIVGDGHKKTELQELISELELEDIVQLVGWKDDIEPFLHEADLSIIPSLWEGFGLVAIEAMSAGLPIIAADVPGLNEVVDETHCPAILVNKENDDEISKGIEKLHKNIKAGYNYRKTAVECAKRFSLDKMIEEYSTLYKEI